LLYGIVAMACRRIAVPRGDDEEIDIIRWYRRLDSQMTTLRQLTIANRWLALAKVIMALNGRRCLRGKHSKRSSPQEI
jgi:hypothetical protein